jgi:uncharacterized membrane protein YkvA (DUF1232 family)
MAPKSGGRRPARTSSGTARRSKKAPSSTSKTQRSGAGKRTTPRAAASEKRAAERTGKQVSRKQAADAAKKYRSRADRYRNDPEATDKLLKDAQERAKQQTGPLSGRFSDIQTLIRLVRAYRKGQYKEVPWETIALAIGALIYLLSPVDLIPDPIPVAGYVDDVAVIGFVVASITVDLENFRDWEETQKAA